MTFKVYLTNVMNESPELDTYEEAVDWVRKACFESTIYDLSVKINFGHLLVATFSPIAGLRDLRPFGGKPG